MKIFVVICLFLTLLNAQNSEHVTLVYITDTTIENHGSFPLTRDVYAEYIESIYKNYSPKVVYINVTIDSLDKNNLEKDTELFEAVLHHKKIVFTGLLSEHKVASHLYESQQISKRDINRELKENTGAYLPVPEIMSSGGHFGIYNTVSDQEGKTVAFPFVYDVDKHIYPSVLLKLVSLYKDLNASDLQLDNTSVLIDTYEVNKNIVDGYYVPSLVYEFDTFSYEDILNATVDKRYIDGRIILLGIDATGIKKTFPTSKDLRFETTKYLANTVESLLNEPKFNLDTYMVLGYGRYLLYITILVLMGMMFYMLNVIVKNKRGT